MRLGQKAFDVLIGLGHQIQMSFRLDRDGAEPFEMVQRKVAGVARKWFRQIGAISQAVDRSKCETYLV